MMASGRTLSLFYLALCASIQAAALSPDIRADTNRDGVVDITGESDSIGKATWNTTRGAIFLPNIGDKHQHCYTKDRLGNALSNDELAYCSDASGHMLLAPEYVAPLRTLPLNVSSDGTAQIYATPRAAYSRVRIFLLEDASQPNQTSSWSLVDREYSFNSSQLAAGLTLGIDGRELVKDATVWNGSVTVVFNVTDGAENASDAVALHLAPVLTHHHLQTVETLITAGANDSDPVQLNFVNQLDEARVTAGLTNPLLLLNQSSDIWAQDFVEPGYASMPGPSGPIAIRIMLRSAQSTRTGGRQVFEQLRGPGIGGFQPPSDTGTGFGHREINSYGNLETIPPYTSRSGVAYKAGRIIMGKHYDRLPAAALLDFLYGQNLQSPLILETGWLLIGHVDEFVQFLPYDNDLGFTISITDTTSALALLNKTQSEGSGDVKAISYTGPATETGMNLTVSELLANATFLEANRYAQRHIDANLQVLLDEIPLDPKDVIYVPTLFRAGDVWDFTEGDGLPPHTDPVRSGEWELMAFNPASINGIVIGRHYISPKPFGPTVNGTDVLAQAVEAAYARAGMSVSYVDDFESHHVNAGEVHCGSNTLRQTDLVWWD